MRIYENAWPSTYEEFKTWHPVWYRDVFEMDAIWQVFGGQMDKIQALLIWMVDSNFIDHADASMITRLENFLGISHPYPRTLVERRAVLRGFAIGRGQMGRRQVIELISIFTSGVIDVSFARPGRINVAVSRDFGDMFNLHDINMIIGHRIPSHLSLWIADFPRPVRAVNSNSFILFDLLMLLCIANITAPCFRLEGSRKLDGSWLLDAVTAHGINLVGLQVRLAARNLAADCTHAGPIKGMASRSLFAGAYKIKNGSRMAGTLAKSIAWKLDGTLALDSGVSRGAMQTLGKLTVKEDL